MLNCKITKYKIIYIIKYIQCIKKVKCIISICDEEKHTWSYMRSHP